MSTVLDLPTIPDARAFHLGRWREICEDASLRNRPERVETNRFGHIIMMPPPGFSHSHHQFEIGFQLRTGMTGGLTLTECALVTTDGVKGIDVAWISEARVKEGLRGDVLTLAPEICVEIISPGNTKPEMEEKRRLYFEAGAEEVWFCDLKGDLHFFAKAAPTRARKTSALCPTMPRNVPA